MSELINAMTNENRKITYDTNQTTKLRKPNQIYRTFRCIERKESELSLDDYAETQKLKVEYTARIDFFNAVGEELQPKLYKKREAVYDEKNAFLAARKMLYRFAAIALMDEFIEANKAQIALFQGMFVYSCDYNEYTSRDGHDVFGSALVNLDAKQLNSQNGVLITAQNLIGGLRAISAPFFPADCILITTLSNLAIYFKQNTARLFFKQEIYFSVMLDYLLENHRYAVLIESIDEVQ